MICNKVRVPPVAVFLRFVDHFFIQTFLETIKYTNRRDSVRRFQKCKFHLETPWSDSKSKMGTKRSLEINFQSRKSQKIKNQIDYHYFHKY